MIRTKSFDIKIENGIITGYASTWTREPDSYGDIVAKGAFAKSIAKIKEEGRVLPLLFNHRSDDLNAYIGTVYELKEDEHGLYFESAFDDTPEAQKVRTMAKDGRLAKFSFSYDVMAAGEITLEDGRHANELRELDIHEVSITLYPANRDTSVVSVKAGRRNSAKDADAIREAITLLQGVLGELEDTEEDPKESDAKSEEPGTANDEEQKKTAALLKEAETILSKGE